MREAEQDGSYPIDDLKRDVASSIKLFLGRTLFRVGGEKRMGASQFGIRRHAEYAVSNMGPEPQCIHVRDFVSDQAFEVVVAYGRVGGTATVGALIEKIGPEIEEGQVIR